MTTENKIKTKEPKSIEKWSIGSYVVFLKDNLQNNSRKIGDISKIKNVRTNAIDFEDNMSNNIDGKFSVVTNLKWFATKSEAEEFAKTLVEEVKEEVKTPQLDLNEWLNKYKKLNLAVNDLANAIGLSNFDRVFLKLEGTNSKEKANILYDLWNPKQPLKQAVHCETQEEWDFVTEKLGYKWTIGSFDEDSSWISLNSNQHSSENYWKKYGYQILSFQEWCDLNGYKTGNEVKSNQEFKVGDWIYPLETGFSCTSHFLYKNQYKKNELMQIEAFDLYNGYNCFVSTKGHIAYIEQCCKKFRLATPEEINNHLISIGQIPAGEPLNTGIEPNKNNIYRIQRDANPPCTFNSIKINGREILKPKMTLSIDDEELPMVNIIKTNTIKQLLNND